MGSSSKHAGPIYSCDLNLNRTGEEQDVGTAENSDPCFSWDENRVGWTTVSENTCINF